MLFLHYRTMRKFHIIVAYYIALFLTGCSLDRLPLVYRLDIHQGNVVTQDMMDQLRPGMTKRQVAFILGAPLLMDPFHDDRWDYVYSNQPNGESLTQNSVSLVFQNDELVSLQGHIKPEHLTLFTTNKEQTLDIPPIDRQKTLWEKITGLVSD